jgi:hypothetical protein
MTKMMRAARLHKSGEPFKVDTIPVPEVPKFAPPTSSSK